VSSTRVVSSLGLDRAVIVVHDGSGPGGINWALAHPDQTAALVLLNTFHSAMPTLTAPEAIRIYSQPEFSDLSGAIAANPQINRWLFDWQVGRFMTDPAVRAETLKVLRPSFRSSLRAFASLNRDLIPAIAANTARVPELATFARPVRVIFGARDPYLNTGVAESFHQAFPSSDLFLLPARHYVQVDLPGRVAALIAATPTDP
jgi:haloalkane dehalogenase